MGHRPRYGQTSQFLSLWCWPNFDSHALWSQGRGCQKLFTHWIVPVVTSSQNQTWKPITGVCFSYWLCQTLQKFHRYSTRE